MTKTNHNPNCIDTIEAIDIGGIKQWVSLRSDDTSNPIILFLHGGPGTAQIALARKTQKTLEKDFIVVNWDQRGAGKSYSSKLKVEDMRIERFVLDAIELVQYLLQRFGQEKLLLVGHSWGSVIGAYVASRHPELLLAYVGIGQVVDMARGELLSYQFTLDEAKRLGNQKAVRELEYIGKPPYANLKASGIQRKWLDKFGGQTAHGSAIRLLLKNVTNRDLSFWGFIKLIQGVIFSLKHLENELNKVNLFEDVTEINAPVFFCCGRRDYTVPFELTVEYFEKLKAPKKEMVWFEHSAHLPNFEEPEVFNTFCAKLKNHI